jgi:hypothetical protein
MLKFDVVIATARGGTAQPSSAQMGMSVNRLPYVVGVAPDRRQPDWRYHLDADSQ